MVIHKSTSECYKTKGTRTSGTGQHNGHHMTSQVAHVDEIDGIDDTLVVAAQTHTDGIAHRCLADDR